MLKVILADNQAIFRTGAAKVLAVEDDLRIVAQAQTAEQMQMALERFRPQVLVCASEFASDLAALVRDTGRTRTRIILVIENGEETKPFLAQGVHGVVYRSITGESLSQCVRTVAKGGTWVQDTKAAAIAAENDMVGARVRDRLTPRELHVVALIVQGFKNKEIASRLGTTEQVIKNYLRNVYDKVGVSDRLELALFTIHHRILAEAAAAIAEDKQ
ncbi:MAG TPA: response regulator transcription factor [Terriglobales bacterium]|nr:response regulator transcription factor [Terriglobales bacterium]